MDKHSKKKKLVPYKEGTILITTDDAGIPGTWRCKILKHNGNNNYRILCYESLTDYAYDKEFEYNKRVFTNIHITHLNKYFKLKGLSVLHRL